MLHVLTASTHEIDSPEDAAEDILTQLDLEKHLLPHAVGIIACHPDFIESGAVRAICAQLPFPVVGATTIANGTNTDQGLESLSLCVLTGDDVTFTATVTAPLTEAPGETLAAAYTAGLEQAGSVPALILAYAPFLPHFGGSAMVGQLDRISGGVPVFGTIGCDQNSDFRDTHTIYNGEHYRDRMALVLISGAVSPRFFVVAVSDGNIQKQKGQITSSDGNILKSVNDLPCVAYMASIGLNPNDGLEGAITIPFIVNYNDGSPPAGRSVYTFTPEGYAICGGEMPLNGTFAVGLLDSREITRSSAELIRTITAEKGARGLLVISCIGRSLALGIDPLAEAEVVRSVVGDSLPLHMAYSGGEICPVYTEGKKAVNRFHNFTLVACLL